MKPTSPINPADSSRPRESVQVIGWRRALVLLAALLPVAPHAHAYLDPGTGSIILQGLIAAVAAVVTYAGLYWQKVKSFFSRRPPPDALDTTRTSPATERDTDADS